MVNATNVFELEGFGAVSRSMGGTSASYYTGNAALISNPATLSMMTGNNQFELGMDFISTDISVSNSAGEDANGKSASNNRGPYFAPQLSYVQKIDQWTIGAGIYANGGLGTEFGNNSFLSKTENGAQTEFENSSRLLVLRAPIGFSFEATQDLNIGASVDLVWTALNLELLLPSSQVGALAAGGYLSGSLVGPLAGFAGTDGGAHFGLTKNKPVGGAADSIGLGGRLGFTYKINKQTTLGAMYNFKTSVGDLKGEALLSGVNGSGGTLPLNGDIRFKDFEMPASLTLGLSHQLNDNWLFAIDLKRTYWSDVMEDIDVSFTSAAGDIDIVLPHQYSDITILSIGSAYRFSDQITLRAGFSYAEQALEDTLILPVIPAYLKKHVTVGGEYRFNQDTAINLALSLGLKESLKTPSYLSGGEQLKQSHSQINAVVSYTQRF